MQLQMQCHRILEYWKTDLGKVPSLGTSLTASPAHIFCAPLTSCPYFAARISTQRPLLNLSMGSRCAALLLHIVFQSNDYNDS